MRRGGFLGASGLTQKDVLDLQKIFDIIGPDDVEQWPQRAAKGELGVFYCKRLWGVERIPAAAVLLMASMIVSVRSDFGNPPHRRMFLTPFLRQLSKAFG